MEELGCSGCCLVHTASPSATPTSDCYGVTYVIGRLGINCCRSAQATRVLRHDIAYQRRQPGDRASELNRL